MPKTSIDRTIESTFDIRLTPEEVGDVLASMPSDEQAGAIVAMHVAMEKWGSFEAERQLSFIATDLAGHEGAVEMLRSLVELCEMEKADE